MGRGVFQVGASGHDDVRCLMPIVTLKLQKDGGQHHLAVLAAFAAVDMNEHPVLSTSVTF